MNTLEEAAAASTCEKRVVVCELYDVYGELLARESNRCAPGDGGCKRMGVVQTQAEYPTESTCNWTHAEIMALLAVPKGQTPTRAVLYGHSFPCLPCEMALRQNGVIDIEVVSDHPVSGLRT